MESITCLDGLKIKGEGAHKEIIDYISREYDLRGSDKVFLQELRDYRNKISYEGFIIKSSYIKSNKSRVEQLIKRLLNIFESKLN